MDLVLGMNCIKMSFIIIYATYKDLVQAKKISSHLLKKKLIACANFFSIKSLYLWKGKIENSNETVAFLKTNKENWKKVKKEITRMHSYDIPCIVKISVESNKSYGLWINSEINNKKRKK